MGPVIFQVRGRTDLMADLKTLQVPDTSERLRRIYDLALTVSGNPIEVFDHIVEIIAELFGVRIALVEKIEGEKIIALSMYIDGRIHHEGEFDLTVTPCANVQQTRSFCSFTSAAEVFPHDSFLREHAITTYIGMPVIGTDGEVIAVINAMNDRPIHLSPEDRLFLEALASRVRLEMERTEKITETAQIRTLLEISRDISQLRGLDDILKIIVDHVKEALGSDIAAFATLDEQVGTTSWKAMAGYRTDSYKTAVFAPGQGTAGRAVASRKTVVLEGIGENPDLPAEEFTIHTPEAIRNAIGVPVIKSDRVVGVLIAGYRSQRTFSEPQIRLAEAIAAHAAVAVENSRLFTELSILNERLVDADRTKTELIAELSTPVMPIWEHVLFVPIIGTLNAERAKQVTDALLKKTAGGGAEIVLLDITGVRTVDTDAAQHLRNTIAAVRVLGARCIITGIGAAVAHTIVRLGINLEGVKTRRKLSDGLQLALELMAESASANDIQTRGNYF